MIQTKVKKSYPKALRMVVYIGFIIVFNDSDKRYLYSKYSDITRLTAEDALNDAIELKNLLIN